MDNRERAMIEDLFDKIAEVESRSPPRDAEAEAFIRSRIAGQPSAPYYMAQTIVVQEQALNDAQRRIEELERELGARPAAGGGGLLGGLFGASPQRGRGYDASVRRSGPTGPRVGGGIPAMGGGGFLAGAAQTAMGVAGGVLLGNMIADWMSPDAASTADAGTFGGDAAEQQIADAGDLGGGDFDIGDF
jgi:hypothetical protein